MHRRAAAAATCTASPAGPGRPESSLASRSPLPSSHGGLGPSRSPVQEMWLFDSL